MTPPYKGQPIPGFSGMIPSPAPGRFIGLPDNGFGAQGNSADFVIGVLRGDAALQDGRRWHHVARPGGGAQPSPRSATRIGLLDSTYITDGPVYNRTHLLFDQRHPGGSGASPPAGC